MISELFLLCAESMHIAETKEFMCHFGKIQTKSLIKTLLHAYPQVSVF